MNYQHVKAIKARQPLRPLLAKVSDLAVGLSSIVMLAWFTYQFFQI